MIDDVVEVFTPCMHGLCWSWTRTASMLAGFLAVLFAAQALVRASWPGDRRTVLGLLAATLAAGLMDFWIARGEGRAILERLAETATDVDRGFVWVHQRECLSATAAALLPGAAVAAVAWLRSRAADSRVRSGAAA